MLGAAAHRRVTLAPLVVALVAACSQATPGAIDGGGDGSGGIPDAHGDGDGAPPTDRPYVTGRVWAPNQGPGVAPPGHEIPVDGAMIHLSVERATPIPLEVYCDRCIDIPEGAVFSGNDGSFLVAAPAAGNYWLTIQKGQFRTERRIHLDGTEHRELTSLESTLPSYSDPINGLWIPRVAVAVGQFDPIEDILGKIGLGTIDANGALASTDLEIDLYQNRSLRRVPTVGSISSLLTSLDTMRGYHIILLPCSAADDPLLKDPATLRNIRAYVHGGGKLYVTDWSGAIVDRAFPPQIVLGGGLPEGPADSIGTYDPVTLDGTLTQVGESWGDFYSSPDGKVVDTDVHRWLDQQRGPTTSGDQTIAFEPDRFEVVHNYNWVDRLSPVPLGRDASGQDVVDQPHVWVTGSNPNLADGVARPLTVSYQPVGCGRVVYSTYHTTGPPQGHQGLYLQERILLYMLMEIGVCNELPEIDQ
jgi:hypothetical protein